MKFGKLLGVMGILAIACSPVNAGHKDEDLTAEEIAIKGLDKLCILVVEDDTLKTAGLDRDKLKTDVELKLRTSGVGVATIQESDTLPGHPVLCISLTAAKSGDTYACMTVVSVMQEMLFKRDPSISTPAWSEEKIMTKGMMCSTFTQSYVEIVNPNDMSSIRDSLKDDLDVFLIRYLKANPRNTKQEQKPPTTAFTPRKGDA